MLPTVPHIDVQALMRGLVHELRNPLSAILTASSLLKTGRGDDEESEMLLDVVEKESRRMNRILTEFSSFVKPPAARPETFDVAQTLRGLTREMRKDGTLGGNIEVRDELPAELPVYSDPSHSHQAFQHLFTNAAEAMPEGGTLHLHVEGDAQTAIIVFDDTGAGFPAETLDRALQPFFSTKAASTGLGLSIASSLLRASGGEIKVHNRVQNPAIARNGDGTGASVRVHLPRGA